LRREPIPTDLLRLGPCVCCRDLIDARRRSLYARFGFQTIGIFQRFLFEVDEMIDDV
jgi:hypothetical protein